MLSMKYFESWSRKILSWPEESRIHLPDGAFGNHSRSAYESVIMFLHTSPLPYAIWSFSVNVYLNHGYDYVFTSWAERGLICFLWNVIFSAGRHPPRECMCSAPLLCTESTATAIISCAFSGSLGCFSDTYLLHVCFIASSTGVIYGSHTDHSSELFVSAKDKRNSWLYYPDGVGLFTQQLGLIGQLQHACITHI